VGYDLIQMLVKPITFSMAVARFYVILASKGVGIRPTYGAEYIRLKHCSNKINCTYRILFRVVDAQEMIVELTVNKAYFTLWPV